MASSTFSLLEKQLLRIDENCRLFYLSSGKARKAGYSSYGYFARNLVTDKITYIGKTYIEAVRFLNEMEAGGENK